MALPRKVLAPLVLAAVTTVSMAGRAAAQTIVDPQIPAERNDGGWVYWLAIALAALGLVIVVFLVIQYMRYAPRFAKDEEGLKVVRADRVRIGKELPRRNVDLSQAAPVVVAPPAVPVAAAALAAPAAEAPAPAAAAEAPAPAAPAPAPAAPAAEAPAPAAAPPAPAEQAPAPAAEAPAAPEAAPPAAPAAPAVPEDRPEVTMDQEAYDAALKELLDAGTDRRIAEGRARRAGMIAARKKAAGEA
jgi:2-oxoglutarate dehydrogenase E2 component (dihydrolipoamide succinyltransferase)